MTLEDMKVVFKRRIITAEHERTLVREFDSRNLNAVMAENVRKSRKCFSQEAVGCMNTLQSGLPFFYSNDEKFKKKLVEALKDVEAFW